MVQTSPRRGTDVDQQVDAVRESLFRCLLRGRFFELLQLRLLAAEPGLSALLGDDRAGYAHLRAALGRVLEHAQGGLPGHPERLQHPSDRTVVALLSGQFSQGWREAVLATVQQMDPDYQAELECHWRAVLSHDLQS